MDEDHSHILIWIPPDHVGEAPDQEIGAGRTKIKHLLDLSIPQLGRLHQKNQVSPKKAPNQEKTRFGDKHLQFMKKITSCIKLFSKNNEFWTAPLRVKGVYGKAVHSDLPPCSGAVVRTGDQPNLMTGDRPSFKRSATASCCRSLHTELVQLTSRFKSDFVVSTCVNTGPHIYSCVEQRQLYMTNHQIYNTNNYVCEQKSKKMRSKSK